MLFVCLRFAFSYLLLVAMLYNVSLQNASCSVFLVRLGALGGCGESAEVTTPHNSTCHILGLDSHCQSITLSKLHEICQGVHLALQGHAGRLEENAFSCCYKTLLINAFSTSEVCYYGTSIAIVFTTPRTRKGVGHEGGDDFA